MPRVSIGVALSRPCQFLKHYSHLAGDLVVTDTDGATVTYNMGDISWVLASTALVWIMVPGVGFFYSGLLR